MGASAEPQPVSDSSIGFLTTRRTLPNYARVL